jgi:hypothetical protein
MSLAFTLRSEWSVCTESTYLTGSSAVKIGIRGTCTLQQRDEEWDAEPFAQISKYEPGLHRRLEQGRNDCFGANVPASHYQATYRQDKVGVVVVLTTKCGHCEQRTNIILLRIY